MNTSLYDCTLKTTMSNFQAKKYPKKITISKWRSNYRFSFCVFSIFKNRFPKEIFQWNLAHVGNHEYINALLQQKLEIFILVEF